LTDFQKNTCGQTDRQTDGQAGMTKSIVTFCSSANVPKNGV